MELFLRPQDTFEKTAGTRMPEDPNAWPQEILQQIFKEVPYMSDFSPHVVMDKVDGEKGYAFGHVTVMNQSETQRGATPGEHQAAGLRQVRIPIVIRDGLMSPLDILITDDSKVLPLTESRLRAAIFRPQAFDVTAETPGDQSMIGQLYPPYRQNHGGFGGTGGVTMGMGSGIMGKEGSAFEAYLSAETKTANVLRNIMGKGKGLVGAAVDDQGERAGKAFIRGATKETGEAVGEAISKHKGKLLAGAGTATVGKYQYDKMRDNRVGQGVGEQLRKQGSILEAVASTLNVSDIASFKDAVRDPNIRLAYEKNAAANIKPVTIILGHGEHQSGVPKLASVMHRLLRPDVVQVSRVMDGYAVKTANRECWAPHTEVISRGAALKKFGSRVVLATDTSGAVTMAEGATEGEPQTPDSDMLNAGPATEFGLYKVLTETGQEITGYIIPNLLDIDGTVSPISLFTNGAQAAIQSDVVGTLVGSDPSGIPTSGTPSGYGAFFSGGPVGVEATIPLKLAGSYEPAPGEPSVFQAETYDGRPVEVSVQPNVQTVVATGDGRMLVPEHWQWLPLDQAEAVVLKSSEGDVPAEKEAAARSMYTTVDIISGGEEFTIRGLPVEKLASAERDFLDVDAAMFLLAGLGVEQGYGIKKLSQALTGTEPVRVNIGQHIKLAEEQAKEARASAQEMLERMPHLRQSLFKEAAFISDPEAVDTVLSLNFINPENIHTFISYLPKIDETQERLCNLLFASRLGLSDVPETALQTAVRGTEEVLEGLKTMTFQGPAYSS